MNNKTLKVANENENVCVICNEDAEYFALYNCNHFSSCISCVIKLRMFYLNNKCVICNSESPEVIGFKESEKIRYFNRVDLEDCQTLPNLLDVGFYFYDVESLEHASKLTSYKCPLTHCKHDIFHEISKLNDHMQSTHRKYYCQVCIQYDNRFLKDCTIYNEKDLETHLSYGQFDSDWNVLIPIHPLCPVSNQ